MSSVLMEQMREFTAMGGKIDDVKLFQESGDCFVDFQYVLMNRWAMDKSIDVDALEVVDVGSKIDFLCYLAGVIPVTHIDIRKPLISVPGLYYSEGNVTNLNMPDASVKVLSCLHVAEHIGLGRYGDKIDPHGFNKACRELSRVLAVGGNLFFAVPTGKPQTVFNAHRVLSSKQVVEAIGLRLVEFSAITSGGKFLPDANLNVLDSDSYGCGLYHFVKDK